MYIVGRAELHQKSRAGLHANLGILWILYGLERLAVALGIFLCIPTLTVMWGAAPFTRFQSVDAMDLFHLFLNFSRLFLPSEPDWFHSGRSGLNVRRAVDPKSRPARSFLALVSGPIGMPWVHTR